MEEEISTAETEQGEAVSNEVNESTVETPNSIPVKRGRGRPQGSKKLKVCVTDVNLTDLGSGISNGESTPTPKRGRGRPKMSVIKPTGQQESGDDQTDSPVKTPKSRGRPKGSKSKTSEEESAVTDGSPKKRGRPKKSLSASAEVLPNGESDVPKPGRGRPKGSGKRKSESLRENAGTSGSPRKRGRPKGSPNKKPRMERLLGESGRGQRKTVKVNYSEAKDSTYSVSETSDSEEHTVQKRRGRPKGSLNKKKYGKVGRPRKVPLLPPPVKQKRGRPRKQIVKRGRPKKSPELLTVEKKMPKVWKALGRPRKYPRADPPEEEADSVPKRRGRPPKAESGRGAHLRKKASDSPSSPSAASPRKRGRPPKSGENGETPRKRGRPKASVNKADEVEVETQLASDLPDESKAASDSSAVGEEEVEQHEEQIVEQSEEMTPTELEDDTKEMLADAEGLEDNNQA
ncbi:chromosomal protein D1-like [Notolabrus celidotus]|uniref:chromosomal protein D1-like n=1 Tax=Notolabrus celidotus TaxID=1203425 RepID=UPI00148FAD2B|nr:chromosomal protein D1-like [Notolabrus celidotus]